MSAVEGNGRKVSVDELFGLAASLGVTVGQLLDPTGPDHRRDLRIDVGLEEGGVPQPIDADVAQLWGASRVVVRLWPEEGVEFALDASDDIPPAARRKLDALRAEASPPPS